MPKQALIWLIGMPGCGKSTLGAMLAERLALPFEDADDTVVRLAGRDIPAMFAEGEDVFRDWETRAIQHLAERRGLVVACGGGVVKRMENVTLMRETGTVLLIDRPLEAIYADIDVSGRPLLKDGRDRLKALYEERKELYRAAAHAVIDNSGDREQAVEHMIAALRRMEEIS